MTKATAEKRAAPRKTGATIAREVVLTEVFERVSCGDSVSAVFADHAKDAAWPNMRTFWKWLGDDKALARYEAALRLRAEVHAESINAIADEEPPLVGDKIDPGYVAWQKNRIDARKWTVSRLLPKKYGDRVDVELGGNVYVTINEQDA